MSRRLRLVNAALRAIVRPRLLATQTPQQVRADFNRAAWVMGKPFGTRMVPGEHWTEVTCGPARDDAAILYLHGGGYIAGSAWTHRNLIGRLARDTGLRVYAPDYRLAPEHPLPAAFEDAVAAWDALVATGLAPERIVLAGDSAGGGLALALLAELCQRGTPPAALAAFSPFTDLTDSGGSLRENAPFDPMFPAEKFPELTAFTLADTPADDPRISPLFAEFPGAPPVLIQVGSTEILRDDSTRMAERLDHFGCDVTLKIWPDAPHVVQMFGHLPEGRAALGEACTFLQGAVTASGSPAGS